MFIALFYLYALFAIIVALSIPASIKRVQGIPKITHHGRGKGWGTFVSVIVPMRNEERNVKRCIGSLLSQDYRDFEVIAVDDMSEDGTLSLLRGLQETHSNLRIVQLTHKPEGWVGKNYAVYEGAKASRGDLLLFVDADTLFHPQMLRSVVDYFERNSLDMLSLFPYPELISFWERVFLPTLFGLLYIVFPYYKVNCPRHSTAFACGPFIMAKKDVYMAVGGHETIKNSMNDDIDLAKLVKGQGYRIAIADGMEVVRVRMYTNFSEIWHGLVKNLYPAIGRNFFIAATTVATLFLWNVLPSVLVPFSVVSYIVAPSTLKLLLISECLWILGVNFFFRMLYLKRLDVPVYYTFLAPLGSALFTAMLITSYYRFKSNSGVVWKGRVYVDVAK